MVDNSHTDACADDGVDMPPIAADVGSSSPKIADDLTEGGRVTNMDTEVSKVAEGPALTQETHLDDTFGVLLEMQWAEINLIDTDGVELKLQATCSFLLIRAATS